MSDDTAAAHFPFTKHLVFIQRQYDAVIAGRLQHLDINRYYYTLLLIAEEDDSLTQQTLAHKMGIDKVSMARMVNYLCKKGYLGRRKNPTDRREYILEITQKGNEVIPQIRKVYCETNHQALEGLSPEVAQAFLSGIKKIQANLSNVQESPTNHISDTISSKPSYQYETQFSDAK